jgi:SAM-dependent methyltransferase
VNFDNSLSVRAARWPLAVPALARLRVLSRESADLARAAEAANIRFADATTRIPCASGSVAAVYSSHMIEHLDRREAHAFLAEVRRILRPGGVVRIAAPDIARLVREYLATEDADGFVSASHMGLTRPAGLTGWAKWILVGPRHHLWMYDGGSLSRLLSEAGFAEAAAMPPGTTRIDNPGQLDLAERAAESVYVEAVQPPS